MSSYRDGLPVRIGERRYLVDLKGFGFEPLDATRQAVDLSREASDATFDTQGIWKRHQSDFIVGAGQDYFDQEDEADRRMFRWSKGIDPWDRRQLRLLPDVDQVESWTTTLNPHGAAMVQARTPAGASFLYVAAGDQIRRFDGTTWSPCSFPVGAGSDVRHLVVVGGKVWAFTGGNIIHANVGSLTFTYPPSGAQPGAVGGTGGGRLIAGTGHRLSEVLANGSLSLIYEHFGGSGFTWRGVCSAPNGIYCWGDDGHSSHVYLLTVVDATGELAPPFPAGTFEPGEFIRTMIHYGGVLIAGTSRGIRLVSINGSGFLGAGPYIVEAPEVRALAAEGDFVWFGWSNYDAQSTGLGRLYPKKFADDFVPAHASDLMAPGQGVVLACASFQGRRYFLSRLGGQVSVWRQSDRLVGSGRFKSGLVTYGTPERKAVFSAEAAWDPLPAGARVRVAVTDGKDGPRTVAAIGDQTGSRGMKGPLEPAINGDDVEVQLTLYRAADGITSPVVRSWTLRALPLPYRTSEVTLPVMLYRKVEWMVGGHMRRIDLDVADEFAYLKSLEQNRTIIELQLGEHVERVRVDSVGITPRTETVEAAEWTDEDDWIEGTWVVVCKTVDPESFVA